MSVTPPKFSLNQESLSKIDNAFNVQVEEKESESNPSNEVPAGLGKESKRAPISDLSDETKEESKEEAIDEGEPENDKKEELAEPKKDQKIRKKKQVYNKLELSALKKGWTPRDEFEGNAADWLPARHYLEKRDLYNTINERNRDIKRLMRSFEKISKRLENRDQVEITNMIQTLEQQREEAVKAADFEHFKEIDKKINQVKEQSDRENPAKTDSSTDNRIHPDVEIFQEENSDWFNEQNVFSAAMKNYAIGMDDQLARKYPNWSISDRLDRVKEHVVKKFPEYFGEYDQEEYEPQSVKKQMATNRQSAESKTQVVKKSTFDDLPPEIQKAGLQFKQEWNKFDLEIYAQNYFKTNS